MRLLLQRKLLRWQLQTIEADPMLLCRAMHYNRNFCTEPLSLYCITVVLHSFIVYSMNISCDYVMTDATFLDKFLQKGGSILAPFADSFAPLYFAPRDIKEVMSTEQPCDLAYEFGDGLFDVKEFPQCFPKPVKHPYPFNDQLVIYIRHIGPGVCIGQAWQEGTKIEQVPRKLCSEILMVKDYRSL
ncbi:hypothetical protein HN873_027678 [Arachis hypogaea]